MRIIRALLVLLIVHLIFSPTALAKKISDEELRIAKSVMITGIPFAEDDIAKIKKPSKYFPYVLGLHYLSAGDFAKAEMEFSKLKKKFKRSKIADYYLKLALFAKASKKTDLNEIVYDFSRQLFAAGDKSYIDAERKDKMFQRISKAYGYSKIGIEDAFKSDGLKIAKWFEAKKTKKPMDYIIMASTRLDKEESLKILKEGYRVFPKSDDIEYALLSHLVAFNIKENALIDKLIKGISPTLSSELYSIEKLCPLSYNSTHLVETWSGNLATTLCAKQLKALQARNWRRVKARPNDNTSRLNVYAKKNLRGVWPEDRIPLLFNFAPRPLGNMYLLNLSKQIEASAFVDSAEKSPAIALKYLKWNRAIFRALGEPETTTLLARRIQMMIALDTWVAEIGVYGEFFPNKTNKMESLKDNIDKLLRANEFDLDYIDGPFMETAGVPQTVPFHVYIANLPSWWDKEFTKE